VHFFSKSAFRPETTQSALCPLTLMNRSPIGYRLPDNWQFAFNQMPTDD